MSGAGGPATQRGKVIEIGFSIVGPLQRGAVSFVCEKRILGDHIQVAGVRRDVGFARFNSLSIGVNHAQAELIASIVVLDGRLTPFERKRVVFADVNLADKLVIARAADNQTVALIARLIRGH